MSEPINTEEQIPGELTPEQVAQQDAEKKAIKGAKYFAELILQLPEHMEFSMQSIEPILKPLTIEMMDKMAKDGFCLTDIRSAIELLSVLSNNSLKRCENQTSNMIHQLYIQTFGLYSPEDEMAFSDIEKRIIETKPETTSVTDDK